MKSPRGFVWLPLLLVILGVLIFGGGAYLYLHRGSVQVSVQKQATTTTSTIGALTSEINTGTIKGAVSFGSSCIPSQVVCAANTNDQSKVFCSTPTRSGCIEDNVDTSFSVGVPPGTYYVYASRGNSSERAYYDENVLCTKGANCPVSSHLQYIPVQVVAGSSTVAQPTDWYSYQGVPDSLPIGGGMSRLYSNFGFSLDYPSDVQATGTVSHIDGTNSFQVAMVGTAGSGVTVIVVGNTTTCPSVTTGPGPDLVPVDSLVLINGVQFTKYKISDPAAGLLGLSIVYQTAYSNSCFTIRAFYEGAEPSHYQGEESQQIAAQNDAGIAKVDAIANSFRFFPN
jgi:hypothetical protein